MYGILGNISLERATIHRYVLTMFVSTENDGPSHLGWVKDPQSLQGLVKARPDPAEHPQIVGRYNVRPKGGRDRNRNGPWLFCCHCQAHTHWEGYILAAPGGRHFLIGSKCGPLHYGADRFAVARRRFKEIEDRESLQQRGVYMLSLAQKAAYELEALTSSEGLAAVETISELIRRASPDMFTRLYSSVLGDEPLKAYTMVRGTKGAMEPALRSVGRLEGASIISCQARTAAREMMTALEALQRITPAQWAVEEIRSLLQIIRAVERSATILLDERRALLKAHIFFSVRNRRRLEQWASPLRKFIHLDVSSGTLVISDTRSKAGTIEVAPLAAITLPRLKNCELISKSTDTSVRPARSA